MRFDLCSDGLPQANVTASRNAPSSFCTDFESIFVKRGDAIAKHGVSKQTNTSKNADVEHHSSFPRHESAPLRLEHKIPLENIRCQMSAHGFTVISARAVMMLTNIPIADE